MGNIVCVGAGGTGMSGLTLMLYDLGYHNIVAIDAVESSLMKKVKDKGIKTYIGHGKYMVQRDDFVIYSDIPAIVDGPETTTSREYQKTPTKKHFHICLSYNQFIAEISKRFITISIAGSNGKTSTTGMMIYTLASSFGACEESSQMKINGELDTGCISPRELASQHAMLNMTRGLGIVGGLMPNFDNQGYAINTFIQSDIRHLFDHIFFQKHQIDYTLLKKYLFVIEACEYKEHFLMYDTDYALVTNIERDHTDYFMTYDSYTEVFLRFLHKTKKRTILTQSTYDTLEKEYGSHPGEPGIVRSHIKETKIIISSDYTFTNSTLIGKYYKSNAGMIIELLQELHLPTHQITNLLTLRKGMGRRMEYIGHNSHGAVIYSDYSHHAPAIKGNIEAVRAQFPDKKIVVLFQPHQAQRVLMGRHDFAQALEGCEDIIIYKLYTAREIFENMKKDHQELHNLNSFDELGEQFAHHVHGTYITELTTLQERIDHYPNDTIIVYFSAGDLNAKMRSLFS